MINIDEVFDCGLRAALARFGYVPCFGIRVSSQLSTLCLFCFLGLTFTVIRWLGGWRSSLRDKFLDVMNRPSHRLGCFGQLLMELGGVL